MNKPTRYLTSAYGVVFVIATIVTIFFAINGEGVFAMFPSFLFGGWGFDSWLNYRWSREGISAAVLESMETEAA